MKYCRRTSRFVEIPQWHRNEIKRAYRLLRSACSAYLGYYTQRLTKLVKIDKIDTEFAAKLAYWRESGALQVMAYDTTEAFKSMADGKYYTSKAKYRQEIRGMGYDEVGNDKQEHRKQDKLMADIRHEQDIKQDIDRS